MLVVGPAWVGDMVMAQSLFKTIKQQAPTARIDVLAPKYTGALLTRMPEVGQHIELPFTHGEVNFLGRWRLAKRLKTAAYQQAIVLPNSFKAALIPFWASIPLRSGYHGEMRYGLLNDRRKLNKKQFPLMVQRFVALASPTQQAAAQNYPLPALHVQPSQQQQVLHKFSLQQDKPIVVLCPGAEYGEAKRWPAEYFAAVALQQVLQGYQVWILGSAKESILAGVIQQHSGNVCIDFTGKTTLAEAIDLMAMADKVVSNDSGLMHIAAALQRPLVALYGSSSPNFTPPLSNKVRILSKELGCSPCFQRRCPLKHTNCLRTLYPEEVNEVLQELSL